MTCTDKRRVALFVPCFVDLFSPMVGIQTATVLTGLGQDVYYPEGQTCCGQPHLNAGYVDDAEILARRLLDLFEAEAPDAVVAPSGSCVSALRVALPRITGFSHTVLPRLFEFSQFLTDELGVTDVGAEFPFSVTWHDGCHPLRELSIREGPRRLLGEVRGLTLVEMDPSDECCGFGGTFSVKMPEVSAAMGERKAAAATATGAEFVASTEPSCLMQIDGILRRRGSALKTIHLSGILAGSADG